MIFVDTICEYPKEAVVAKARRYGGRWCHMWCDGNVDELHRMAEQIFLKREYFQNVEGFPHYDLVESRRKLAIQFGAQEVSLRAWIKAHRKATRKKRKQ
jgi:hypothetical protein